MNYVTQRILGMLAFVILVGSLGLLARNFASMQWLVENESRMREFVIVHPLQGWCLGFAIYTSLSLVPFTAGKSVVVGWLFEFWSAVLMVDLGLTIAAVGGFMIARFVVRDVVRARFANLARKLDQGLERNGAYYMLIMRIAHAPFSLLNYAAGATSMRLRTFGWTTALGILPGTMIFVFVGSRIPTLRTIVDQGVWSMFDPLLIAIFAGLVVIPLLIGWATKHFGNPTRVIGEA